MNKIIITNLPSLATMMMLTLAAAAASTMSSLSSASASSFGEGLTLESLLGEGGGESSSSSSAPPTTMTPTTGATQQVIDRAQTDCSLVTSVALASMCVSVLHESSRTIVLQGDLLIVNAVGSGGYTDNPFIWQAVDGLKNQGYTLHSVQLAGQGTQGNPHEWYIVMSK
jgi:hypothetical protein